MKYENAANILPPELLEEVRKYFPGGLLWVPQKGDPNLERDELIVMLVGKKVPVKEVAALAKMTPRQVYRIIKKRAPKQARPEN